MRRRSSKFNHVGCTFASARGNAIVFVVSVIADIASASVAVMYGPKCMSTHIHVTRGDVQMKRSRKLKGSSYTAADLRAGSWNGDGIKMGIFEEVQEENPKTTQ